MMQRPHDCNIWRLSTSSCCFQVFDMLMAAGLSYTEDALGEIFDAACLSDASFKILQTEMKLEGAERLSYRVLADCFKRTSVCSRGREAYVQPERSNAVSIRLDCARHPLVYDVGSSGIWLVLQQTDFVPDEGVPSGSPGMLFLAINSMRPDTSVACHIPVAQLPPAGPAFSCIPA